MLQFLIPAIFVLLAVVIITVIVIRHFPQAAAIDIDKLPAEQEAAMKAALMERRLKRKVLGIKNKLAVILRKLGRIASKGWKNIHKRVVALEQKYREKPHLMTNEKQVEVKQKIRNLIDQAEKFNEENNLTDAEAKYIEILSWDHKNLEAYVGLGQVYCTQREYKQAKETYSYLLKLVTALELGDDTLSKFSAPLTDTQINEAYFNYVVCLQRVEENDQAMQQLKDLLDRDSKNPKYLDKAVELSILIKDHESARKSLEALKAVNPDNQKLVSFEEQIRNI